MILLIIVVWLSALLLVLACNHNVKQGPKTKDCDECEGLGENEHGETCLNCNGEGWTM